MSSLSFSEKRLLEDVSVVVLIESTAIDGDACYVYLEVQAQDIPALKIAASGSCFTPEAFGTILRSGMGNLEAAVKKQMEQEYQFIHGHHAQWHVMEHD